MRILHTSDWHIGKRLMGRERLDEQSAALDEIVGICEREEVELVLVAGDIFDTYLPSAEAEDLFFPKSRRWREKTAPCSSSAAITTTAFGCPPPRPCPKSLGFISSEMRENPCR